MIKLLTAKQVAEFLSWSVRQVYREKSAGRLPKPVRIGKKSVRWNLDDLQDWLKDRKSGK